MSNKKKNIIICFYLVILILISGISFVVIAIKKRKDSSGDEMRETNKIDQLELNKNKIKESIYEFHQNEFFHKDKTKTKAYLNDFEFLRSYLEKNPDQFLKDRFNKIEKEINDFDTLIQNFFHLCLDIKNNNNSYVQKEIDFHNQEFKAVVSKIKENMKVNNFDFLEKLGNVKNIVFKDKIDQLESNKNKIKKNIYEFYQNKTKTKAYLNDFEFLDSYFKEDDYYNFGFDYFQEKINQKLRFHQIEKEINDFDVVIKNFFNLYLNINNKNNNYGLVDINDNSYQKEISLKNKFNQEFTAVVSEIDEKMKTNNFDFLRKMEKLQLIFKVFKNNNIDFRYNYNSIIRYVEENFYGQIELISSFTSFIKKERSFKMIFALVGCPSSGKTTFVKTFTEGLNSVISEHYCFKKISVFDVLQQEFLDLDFKLNSNLVSYTDYFSFYLLKQMAACEYKMVVLFDLDQVPNRFLDFLITLNDENSFLFQNLIIFLSFSSRYSYRLSSQFSDVFKVDTNTMQTYSMNHIFNIFNHAIIPKKVDEVKNHIFSLLKKNKIFNDDEGDDELKAEIFENFDITVYETRFLYHFISFFQNKNKAKDFDSKCHCVIITGRKLEKLADKIINMLTGDIIEKLSNEQITKDEVLDVLNFKKTLKMDEYQEFMEKERDIAMGNRDKNCQ